MDPELKKVVEEEHTAMEQEKAARAKEREEKLQGYPSLEARVAAYLKEKENS